MPTDHKTLTFPPKSEWPTFSTADWASVNRRYAFLNFKRRLISMFTDLDFVVGNDNYGGEWALLGDTAERKAHKTYPPPTSARANLKKNLMCWAGRRSAELRWTPVDARDRAGPATLDSHGGDATRRLGVTGP